MRLLMQDMCNRARKHGFSYGPPFFFVCVGGGGGRGGRGDTEGQPIITLKAAHHSIIPIQKGVSKPSVATW